MEEHLSAGTNIHHEEKLGLALEGPVKLNYKGMIEFFHNLSLVYNRFDLLFADQLVLSHNFHSVKSTSILFSHENDSAKSATAYDFDLFEIVS